MESQKFIFKIKRQHPDEDGPRGYDSFTFKADYGLTVLEALISLQEYQDPTLSFRYSCRGAVCGACSMVINKKIKLACRTQVLDLNSSEIILEPLPNLPVIKDLVVDTTEFWEKNEYIMPWLEPQDEHPETERLMDEKLRVEIDQYAKCILCACCYSACPVPARSGTKDYLGPAALAKNLRFYADPREGGRLDRLDRVNSMKGLWGCDTIFRCVDFCPKDVRPAHGIVNSRKKLIKGKLFPFSIKKK